MKLRAALLLLAPAIVFFFFSFVWPIIMVVRLSLFDTNYIASTFVGLGNFANAFHDKYFIKSFFNAFVFVIFVVPATILIVTSITLFLMDFNKRVQSVSRFIIYVPALASGYIVALLWKWFLLRDGLVNHALSFMNIEPVSWLFLPWAARVALSAIEVVSGLGVLVILLSASLHAIPNELQDAALIDGATNRQYKRFIVLPLLVPTILLASLLETIGVMQIWSTIYILTPEGGPDGATASPVYEIFLTAFHFGKHGYGAAKGILLMIIIAAIILFKQRIERAVKK